MRYLPDHKGQTRRRILDAAAAVFRRQGYRGAGVDAVMQEAGLTAGGFYAHFPSKEALFAETLADALRQSRLFGGADFDHLAGPDWVRAVAAFYLSPAHRRLVGQGCPLPPLLAEVARASPEARQAVGAAPGGEAGRGLRRPGGAGRRDDAGPGGGRRVAGRPHPGGLP